VRGLPAGWYTDPGRGPLEFSGVFARSWQFACHVADLPAPGTVARFDCADQSVFVLRTRALELRAFRNVCRHRGSRLVDGDPGTGLAFCVDGRVRCPYHGWTYDEDGRLESVPDGQRFDEDTLATSSLTPLPVAQWHGLVFVAFGAAERALADAFGDAGHDWPDFTALRRWAEPRVIEVAVDWKLACEHALDTAHLRVVRASPRSRLFEPVEFSPKGPDVLVARGVPVETTRASWPARTCLQLLGERGRSADFLFLWPNLLLCRAEGTLTVVQALPRRPGACRLRAMRYGVVDSSRDALRVRYLQERVLRRALVDDAKLLERAQHGVAMLEPAATMPVDAAQPGLHWFIERCRAMAAAPDGARKPRARTRQARAQGTAPAT
jgi:phenylpropionate dioxygenase-like ring-hydroxylating dioxygenase large terminal subunit